MVFVAEALGGWLVGQLADAGRKGLARWLLGDEQERALRKAATAAIEATAGQLRPEPAAADDPQGADHLARVIDHVFQQGPTPDVGAVAHGTLLEGLQAGVEARLAVLGDTDITETGSSSAEQLGVTVEDVTATLTRNLLGQIVSHAARGGPLTPWPIS